MDTFVKYSINSRIAITLCALLCNQVSYADFFDADDADSLDFERVHKQTNSTKQETTIKEFFTSDTHKEVTYTYRINSQQQRFEGEFNASANLYKEMTLQCPTGWEKHKEWATHTNNNEYQLHIEFSCIK